MGTIAAALTLAVCAGSATARPASLVALREGAYKLTGYNSEEVEKPSYRGYVIVSRTGKTYSLVWKIGSRQTQKGVALLAGDVLSVSYYDMSGRDMGVVAYRIVGPGRLDGRWAPHGSQGCGREVLVWKSPAEALKVESDPL